MYLIYCAQTLRFLLLPFFVLQKSKWPSYLTFFGPCEINEIARKNIVSLAAVSSLVTQRSSPQTAVCGEERCMTRLKPAARETRKNKDVLCNWQRRSKALSSLGMGIIV